MIAIISLLIALLLPSLRAARGRMKALSCSSNLRTTSFQFQLFAQGETDLGRGDSDEVFGAESGLFYVEDFLQSLYGVSEFWNVPGKASAPLEEDHLLACPAQPRTLSKFDNQLDLADAVQPLEAVSLAINMRLYRAVITTSFGPRLSQPASTFLSQRALEHPFTPLVIEVDGAAAKRESGYPFYITPPIDGTDDPYASGRYWSPARRHDGKTLVGFIGGHVLKSEDPRRESWDWRYQAETR